MFNYLYKIILRMCPGENRCCEGKCSGARFTRFGARLLPSGAACRIPPSPPEPKSLERGVILKLALQYEMQRPSLDDHLVLQETMEQCILADEVGFDYLWFVEHHFLTGFSASPCPDLIFAALSQRTKQIRLGLGVVILPYHHPNRVAERVAMLDHLSKGSSRLRNGPLRAIRAHRHGHRPARQPRDVGGVPGHGAEDMGLRPVLV